MANPYEVLTVLITALKNKLDAGTATPQEVLIYTKGAELLRAGGDIDAIVAGLLDAAKTSLDGAVDDLNTATATATGTLTTASATLNTTAEGVTTAVSTAQTALSAATLNTQPVGSVIHAVGMPPGGKYLKLDGAILSQADYPDLYAVIGLILQDRIDVGRWAAAAMSSHFNTLCLSNSTLVAAGDSGSLYTSSDGGMTWTSRTSQFSSDHIYRLVDKGDGSVVVAVGGSGKISSSYDNGATWTARTAAATTLNDVIYANGIGFVAVGAVYNSTSPVCSTSIDGASWTAQTTAAVAQTANKVVWDGVSLVMVGNAGMIQTSPTGVTWTSRTSNISGNLTWVATNANNSLLVAVGNYGYLVTSADHGATWTARASGHASHINFVTYANNLWVAVGSFSAVLTSADGINWNLRQVPVPIGETLMRALWTGSRWLVVGTNSILITSTDGVVWSKPVENTILNLATMNAMVYTNGRLVAVGNSGTVMRQWSAYNPATEFGLPEVTQDHYGVQAYVRALP